MSELLHSCHVMTVDLPVGPSDLGAEIEVIISFDCRAIEPATVVLDFTGVLPLHPFCGVYADMEQERLESSAQYWFESAAGQDMAFGQVAIDHERTAP